MATADEYVGTDTAEFLAFDDLVARFFEAEPRTVVSAEFGAITHPGLVREVNEDHYIVVQRRRQRDVLLSSLPVELLEHREQVAYALAIADGMGGHVFGELASLLALSTGWDLGGQEIKWPLKMNEREAEELRQKATVLFRMLDQTIHAAMVERPRLAGMGTTLTIAYTTGRELFVLHAGDSRAYLYRKGEIKRLTHDHTLAQTMIDAGVVSPGSPEERKARHILTNCLGGPAMKVEVDVKHTRLRHGDRLLLCTDGLTDEIDDAELAGLLSTHNRPEAACRALVDLALERGGRDNVTVIVGQYAIPDDSGETPESDRHR